MTYACSCGFCKQNCNVTDSKQALQGPMSPTERILLSQRLIEILSRTDPAECEQELRKLKRELDMKSELRVIVIFYLMH